MKKLIVCVTLMSSLTGYSADCTKADAKKAVEWACKKISEKGEAGKLDVKKYKYCGQNYVWLQDKDVKMVMHPIKPKLNGKSLLKYKDKKSKPIFIEFDKMARSKKEGGWVDYVWPKPQAESATPKTSFVKVCDEKTKWVAGSGIWTTK